MRFLLLFFTLLPLALLSNKANAWSCQTVTSSTTISAPTSITIPSSTAIYSEILTVSSSVISAYSCSNTSPVVNSQNFGLRSLATSSAGTINGRKLYNTNIDGIGYAVGGTMTSNCSTTASGWITGSNLMGGKADTYSLCSVTGMFPTQPISGKMTIIFYKTAQQTGSGTITNAGVASFVLLSNGAIWYPANEAKVIVTPINIVSPACTVNSTSIPVQMGIIKKSDFSGVGSWPGDGNTKSFEIPLTCNAGTKVSMQIDSGSIQNATQGIINTTTGDKTATGIGIQLLYNNSPLKLASTISVGTATQTGTFSIPLKARYYQIANKITAGAANATATFTMTYN